jgi:hypothetical protein
MGDARTTFSRGGVLVTRKNIFALQVREVVENFLLGHTRSKISQHVIHGHPHAANARLSAAHTWINRDSIHVVHDQPSLIRSIRFTGVHPAFGAVVHTFTTLPQTRRR